MHPVDAFDLVQIRIPLGLGDGFFIEVHGGDFVLSTRHLVHYPWPPLLPDPMDDLVLEAALASNSRYIS